jgi:hypothetical protein
MRRAVIVCVLVAVVAALMLSQALLMGFGPGR